MIGYIFRRVLQSAVLMVLVSVAVFAGARKLPGNPIETMAAQSQSPAAVAKLKHSYGLDKPIHEQYLNYVRNALTGDFGSSLSGGENTSKLLRDTLPVTLQLAIVSIIVAVLFGVGIGTASSYWYKRWPDWIGSAVASVGLSIPFFWLGMLLVLYATGIFTFLPTSGYVSFSSSPAAWLLHLVLPAVTLGSTFAAIVTRQTRSSMRETMASEFVLACRARGLGEFRVVRHALRNSLVVIWTLFGLQFGAMLSSAAVVEEIFALPGIGRLTVESFFARDYTVITAVVLVIAAVYILANLVVDLVYPYIDPRIALGRSS